LRTTRAATALALRALLVAGLLGPGLARGDDQPGGAPRGPFARSFPLVFDSERVTLEVLGDSLEVRGSYLLRCQGRGGASIALVYPFPQDSLLGGWRFISLAVRPGLAGAATPACWDALPGRAAVRWWLPPCASDTLVAEAVYRQALRGDYARYIVTTTQAWERPLRRAAFEIRLPAGVEPVEFSFPFAASEGEAGVYRYEATNFLPDRDITLRWRSVPPVDP
jgi:hypothetical protein